MSPSSSPEDPPLKPLRPGRGFMLTGVAAAALMGVGLGLWARPAMSERQMALPLVAAARPAETRKLQIVLDDTPAPLGPPIELLPASSGPPRSAPPAPELLAPVRPAAGLVRVRSLEPEPVEAAPRPEPKPSPRKLAAPPPAKVKAVAAPKTKPPKLEKAKALQKAKVKPAASKIVKAAAKPARTAVRLAKADRPQKPARIEKAAVKRPAELFQLQGKLPRRNFDAMVPYTSKNTDAVTKLADALFAPISGRIRLAAEKISKAA